jgi:hypothetical protein
MKKQRKNFLTNANFNAILAQYSLYVGITEGELIRQVIYSNYIDLLAKGELTPQKQ